MSVGTTARGTALTKLSLIAIDAAATSAAASAARAVLARPLAIAAARRGLILASDRWLAALVALQGKFACFAWLAARLAVARLAMTRGTAVPRGAMPGLGVARLARLFVATGPAAARIVALPAVGPPLRPPAAPARAIARTALSAFAAAAPARIVRWGLFRSRRGALLGRRFRAVIAAKPALQALPHSRVRRWYRRGLNR